MNKKQTTVRTVVTKEEGGKKKKRNRNRAKIPREVHLSGGNLSSCGKQYLLALTDAKKARSPCVPDLVSLPSLKFSVQNRGTFSTGINNFGYILVNPVALAYNNGTPFGTAPLAAGAYPPAILTTNAGYTYNGFIFSYGGGLVPAGIDQTSGNSAFDTAGLLGANNPTLIKYRLVGCTVECSYEGTELNLGGRAITAFSRGSDSLIISNTAVTSSVLLRDRSYHMISEKSNRKSHFVNYLPSNIDYDLNYCSLNTRLSGYQGTTSGSRYGSNGYSLLIGLQSAAPAAVYGYTVTAHFEAIGPIIPTYATSFGTSLTRSESDPIGMSSVLNSINEVITSGVDQAIDDPNGFFRKVNGYIGMGMAMISGINQYTSSPPRTMTFPGPIVTDFD